MAVETPAKLLVRRAAAGFPLGYRRTREDPVGGQMLAADRVAVRYG